MNSVPRNRLGLALRCVAAAAILAGPGGAGPAGGAEDASLPGAPTVESADLRLRFDPERGRLVELLDKAARHDHVDRSAEVALWTASLAGGGDVGPADAERFSCERLEGSEPGLELGWAGFDRAGLPALRVSVRVALGPERSTSRWRIAVEGLGDRGLREVRFPRIAAARQEEETLSAPVWMGERTRKAREIVHRGGSPGRLAWEYPGLLSMQCLALYREGGPGLRVAANDSASLRKLFSVVGAGREGLCLEVSHVPPVPGGGAGGTPAEGTARHEPPYDVIVGTFRGDWFTAAETYRAWALDQPWARESRLRRGRTPEWLRDTGLWVWNRGRSPGVLGPAAALRERADVPVSVFWHWWHGCAYDSGFPEYLPPREGADAFRHALSDARAQGIHAIVYMNQRLWGMTTRSWVEERAERYAVKSPDGSVVPEVYNTFTRAPCASMCMGTAFWRSKYAGLAEAAVRDLGVDGIYMDQACSSLACYDPAHGHPLGGGGWWMDGFRRLEGDIRARCAGPRAPALAGEGCGEAWLPHLDAMLSLQVSLERYAAPGDWEPIPFFHAVYHDCAVLYGNYSSLTRPPYDDLWPAELAPGRPLELLDRKFSTQFRLEQARAFVWGQQPTIANFLPSQLAERAEEIDYVVRLARLRRESLSFLRDGVMLRAPVVAAPRARIPMSRLSIYAGQQDAVKEYEAEVPLVLASAWRAPDGRVAVAVASISDRPVEVGLSLRSPEHPVPGSGRILRISEEGRTEAGFVSGGAAAWAVSLGPRGACVYELLPE